MNQANVMLPANRAVDTKKNARDRNASASSVNVRNKAAVAARNVVAASRADDKPGYWKKKRRELPSAAFLSVDHVNCRRYRFHGSSSNPDKVNPTSYAPTWSSTCSNS